MAPKTLEELLVPLTRQEFLEQFWGRKYCHIKGTPRRFADLLTWSDINRILRQHRLDYPRLRIALEGESSEKMVESFIRPVPTRRGVMVPRLDPVTLSALLRRGAALIIDAIDETMDPIETLAVNLERELSEYVQVNVYAAWGDKAGFRQHWDDHDVLILQVAGRKYWKIHGITREAPLFRDDEKAQLADQPPPGPPIWEGMLEDGDFLYLPRGVWHSALPINEPTLHLTFGVTKRTGIDFLAWFLDKLRDKVAYRADLPRFLDQKGLAAHQAQLLQQLLTTWQSNSIADYLTEFDALAISRAHMNLPYSVAPETLPDSATVQIASPRPFTASAVRDDGNSFEFRACGKKWCFAREVEPIIKALFQGVPVTVGALMSLAGCTIDRDSLHNLLRDLLIEGLLVLAE